MPSTRLNVLSQLAALGEGVHNLRVACMSGASTLINIRTAGTD